MTDKRKKKEARRAARKSLAARKRPKPVHRDVQGRPHLVVFSEGSGGPERLSLSEPLFHDAWQNDIALAAAGTAHGLLREEHSPQSVVALAHSAMNATSKLAEGFLAQAQAHPPACSEGCAHCCYQAVGVVAPEVLAIHEHLRATRSPDELEAIATRVRAADDRTRGLSGPARSSPDLPCPLLEDNRCAVYEVRPLACRGANSLDASRCEEALREPDANLRDGAPSIPRYLEPIRAVHAVSAGIQLSLAELHGLSMLPLELTAALRILLDDPEGVSERWLAGGDPFSAARGGDIASDPRGGGLSGRR